jgi:two-component system chemotaxis response regulator CheB
MQTLVRATGGALRASVEPPAGERFVPSIDRLLESAAEAMGADVIAVVLTGMAGEGGRGARAVAHRGGAIIVEAPETALLGGMPGEVIRADVGAEVVPLGGIAAAIARRI